MLQSTPYDVDNDPVIHALRAEAEADPDVIGLVLTGSRAYGITTDESDYDVVFVVSDEAVERYEREERWPARGGAVDPPIDTRDIWNEALATLGADISPRMDASRVLYDRTGETTAALAALTGMAEEQARELAAGSYDAYLNAMYRSLKSWHRGNELGGRLEAADSIHPLLDMLFALEGRWRPFSSRLYLRLNTLDGQGWQPGELSAILTDLVSTGDPLRQQALARRIADMMRERGYQHVYDSWDGNIDRALSWQFA